mmetsp:Transcript_17033/g.64474  ORF Transcript_17033/g.64474 Transcript_17033/m.64474 type:complete len:204 (-) Transcript_17033:1086-1697(-)
MSRFASSISRASFSSCRVRSASSRSARRSSASCLAALSMMRPPISSFSCICASAAAILSRSASAAWWACNFSSSSFRRISRSSSVRVFSERSFSRSAAAWRSSSSRSAAALASSSFRSSSLMPMRRSITCGWPDAMGTATSFPSTVMVVVPAPLLRASSSVRRRSISSWNSRSMASLGSSLILGLFLIRLARSAYRSVDSVSS